MLISLALSCLASLMTCVSVSMNLVFYIFEYYEIKVARYLLIIILQLNMKLALLLLLAVAALAVDYCQQTLGQTNLYLTPQETRVFPLGSYVKGFDLTFTVDDPTSTKIYTPLTLADTAHLDLKDYNLVKSVDVRKSPKANGMGFGAYLLQKENDKQIAVWMGKFQGVNRLPDMSKFRFFTLPAGLAANCFDLKVASDDGSWGALNCQTIPQTQTQLPQDLLCSISEDDTELSLAKNCKLFFSIAASRERKSSIFQTKTGDIFLFSANTHQDGIASFITIYYFNSNNQFVFNNIIDASSQADQNLQISDFTIAGDNIIVVADSHSSRLFFFTFSLSNKVDLLNIINYPGRPLAVAYSAVANTLSVATKDVINEHNFANPTIIVNQYQVDTTDSLIINLQVSKSLLSYTTLNKNIYIYERSQLKINYLLAKVEDIGDTLFLLSQQGSYVFSFAANIAQSSFAAQPFLQISKLDTDKVVKVSAKSTSQVCQITLNLKSILNNDDIVTKMPLDGQSFKIDQITGLEIQLDDYFGGSDLQYSLPETTSANKDFIFEIKHLNQYVFAPSFAPTEASTILHIDESSFYYIGVNTIQESYTYIDKCMINDNGFIGCSNYAKIESISKTKKAVQAIKAGRRSNGQSFVIWSFKYSGRAEWVYIEPKKSGFFDHSYPLAFTDIQITDSYFVLLSKTGRSISILFEKDPYYAGITETNFNAQQLVEVEYFYPRQIYIDRNDANILYVKLPTKIAKFHILGNQQVEYVGIVREFGSYILDKDWSINYDSKNVITYRDGAISEEYYNNADLKYTKTYSINYNAQSDPIQYDQNSQISYIVSTPNTQGVRNVKIMKPFQGALDSEYYELQVKGDVSLSGNWLLVNSDDTISVYFIDSHPKLRVTANIPEDQFKEDVALKVQVKSKTQTQESTTQIEGVNYPVNIKNFPNDTVVKLPYSANAKQIKLPIDKYFSGPVAYYALSCPMCGGSRIRLDKPLVPNGTIQEVPAIVDFVAAGENVVGLSFNMLFLMSQNLSIIAKSALDKVSCTNLQYNKDIGLLVFCTSQTGEEILKYTIAKDDFNFQTVYVFQGDNKIDHFDEMFAVRNGESDYLFILDNDESLDSNNKRSTIKMFDITTVFTYAGEWNSQTFLNDKIYPINDLEIINDQIFVTIGNYGIGYATFTDGALSNIGTIQLASIPEVKSALLQDSFFKQVEILKYNQAKTQLKIFLTTTNSLSMVIVLGYKDKVFSFKQITQAYFRYGNERLLNWHAVTDNAIYLSYYNQNDSVVNLVYYKRAQKFGTHFTDGILIRVAKSQLKYHEAFLFNNKLITSHLQDIAQGQLSLYNIRSDFVLWIDYTAGGDFKEIQITAFNDFKQAVHVQPVQFQAKPPVPPTPESDGVKWYIVVIVCLVVLIAVGTAYGLFRYMKKKRAEKSVSLLTQKEEGQEQDSGDKEEIFNQSTTKDGLNRSSINAND